MLSPYDRNILKGFWDKNIRVNTLNVIVYMLKSKLIVFVLGSTLPGRLYSGHKYSQRRFELWVRHVCALSCFLKAPCLQWTSELSRGFLAANRLDSNTLWTCRKIIRRRAPLEMGWQKRWLLKCCCRTSRGCLTLIRKSSATDPCIWGETPDLRDSYPTACIAELWTSDRRPSPPACPWPCCPSWQHAPCTAQPCPTRSCPVTLTVPCAP